MKKALLAVSGLALAVTLSACATKPVAGRAFVEHSVGLVGNAQELVRTASAKTDQAKTAKFTLHETLGSQQLDAQGEGRYGGPDTAMDMTMTVLGQEMEVRVVDRTFYLKVPPAEASQLTGGKPWGQVAADSAMAKTLGAGLDQAEQNDPSKILEQINQAGTITKSEQTTLDGQLVSHYWVDLDLAKAAASFTASSGLPAEQLQKIAGKVKTIPMQLWLNEDSLPVRVSEDLTELMKAAGAPDSATPAIITVDYHDWGTPVDITAPPADQVGELQLPGN